MRIIAILSALALLIGGVSGCLNDPAAKAANAEVASQAAEIKQCRDRLAQFYKAVNAYKADHKGGMPPSIESLVPRYIPDPAALKCPTAERWAKNGKIFAEGGITIGGKRYPVTYGCLWLGSGFTRSVKIDKERAPLLACEAHEEAMYRAAYKKPPPSGAFSAEGRTKLTPEVRNAHKLVVRANGEVGELDPSAEQ